MEHLEKERSTEITKRHRKQVKTGQNEREKMGGENQNSEDAAETPAMKRGGGAHSCKAGVVRRALRRDLIRK